MAVDTSIYNALLRPPKSVAEYDAEAMQGQQNKLALQMGQAKMAEYQRGVADEDAVRGVVSKFGTDKTANYNALLGSGRLKEAQAYEKSNADIGKTAAEARAKQIEGVGKSLDIAGQALGFVFANPTPENANSTLEMLGRNGIYSPEDIAHYRQVIAADPSQIRALAEQAMRATMAAKDQLPKIETRNLGATTDTLSIDPLTGRTAVVNSAMNTQSPDSKASERSATASRAQSAQQHNERLAFDKAKPSATAQGKPMPTAALKMQQGELDAIGIAAGIQADLGAIEGQIKAGKLDFGPVSNLMNKGRNLAGMSTESSRNMASFKSSLEKLRNDSLRLNTGVQTDGDAQRAWNELFENINDKGVVTQRLAEIKKLNARAVNLRKLNIDGIRTNYGRDPLDTTGYEKQEPALGGAASNIDSLLDKYKD